MTSWNLQTKNNTTFSQPNRTDVATWDDAIATWDAPLISWDWSSTPFALQTKNPTTFSLQTKN